MLISKGKGEMTTYWLLGESPSVDRAENGDTSNEIDLILQENRAFRPQV